MKLLLILLITSLTFSGSFSFPGRNFKNNPSGIISKVKSKGNGIILKVLGSLAAFGVVRAGEEVLDNAVDASGSCSNKTVPGSACALLYDEYDCSGWEHEVPTGYSEFSSSILKYLPSFLVGDTPKKNDAESVLVRPGCLFVGYDHANRDSLEARGDSIEVDAVHSNTTVKKNMELSSDLHEDISAMSCTCS